MKKHKGKVIAIDFDGTLCTECYPEIGEPKWRVINAAKEAYHNGACLVLWTLREGELLQQALDACTSWGLHFDTVNANPAFRVKTFGTDPRKVGADEYWDDRNAIVTNDGVFNSKTAPDPRRNWILTDDDSCQYVRQPEPEQYPHLWEVIQLVHLNPEKDWWGVAITAVDLTEYIGADAPNDNKQDLDFILSCYDYDDIGSVILAAGAQTEQILAECVAETRFEGLSPEDCQWTSTFDSCMRRLQEFCNRGVF